MNNTLKDFYWGAQPHAIRPVIDFMNAWRKYATIPQDTKWLVSRGMINDAPRKPLPYLFFWGPNNTGKTMAAKAIGRWFSLNFNYSFQYVHWATYVQDLLSRNPQLEVNWDAKFLLLDDFDSWRPIPKSGDTWILQRLMPLRNREWPGICVTNRQPNRLKPYFSTSVAGEADDDTVQAAMTVLVGMARKSFYNGGVEFKESKTYGPTLTTHNAELQRLAKEEQDFFSLGFPRDTEY